MARVKGTYQRDYNNEVVVRKPIDARTLVPKYSDLTDLNNWLKSGTTNQIIAYNGLIVSVADTTDTSKNGIYYLFDPACTTSLKSPDVTKESNWHKVGDNAETADLTEVNVKIQQLEANLASTGVSIASVSTAVSKNTDDIATLISADFVTSEALAARLDSYATKADVSGINAEIAALAANVTGKADLAVLNDYYKKAEAEARFTTIEAIVGKEKSGDIAATGIFAVLEENKSKVDNLSAGVADLSAKLNGINTTVIEAIEEAIAEIPEARVEVATEEALGGIKSSSGDNKVSVAEDGVASVKSVNVNSLTQDEGDILILNGGGDLTQE